MLCSLGLFVDRAVRRRGLFSMEDRNVRWPVTCLLSKAWWLKTFRTCLSFNDVVICAASECTHYAYIYMRYNEIIIELYRFVRNITAFLNKGRMCQDDSDRDTIIISIHIRNI